MMRLSGAGHRDVFEYGWSAFVEALEAEAQRRAPDLAEAARALEIVRRLGTRGVTREALVALVERIELMGDDDVHITLRYADLFERLRRRP